MPGVEGPFSIDRCQKTQSNKGKDIHTYNTGSQPVIAYVDVAWGQASWMITWRSRRLCVHFFTNILWCASYFMCAVVLIQMLMSMILLIKLAQTTAVNVTHNAANTVFEITKTGGLAMKTASLRQENLGNSC